ncbi:hypothetical protein RF11_06894 [Thelohanellus kitauei]|uniref:Uncharacterized protein n=1 Tax=Thelohanellus kitauei TaxID=669202 RepID=A0A0C2M3P3_THEKT|nr:hypothetical protein RF11_06894 [Thelohanellus kitauei]
MASDVVFYKMLLNNEEWNFFLIAHKLKIDPNEITGMRLRCRNQRCKSPSKGFKIRNQRWNLVERNGQILEKEGQNIEFIPYLRCKACEKSLSPRTNGFTSYFDALDRSNCRLSPEKTTNDV